MKVSNSMQVNVSKIVKKQRFVKDIFASIFNVGGKVLLVGGAVRDLLLEKSCKDLDFEVYGVSLDQLEQILHQYGPVSLIGKSFGVLRLHGIDIDWSLPRKDSSGRHPIVAYDPLMSYKQAFIRRDLTINAMGIDMQTFELVDLYGGLQDLTDKVLRAPDLEFFAQDPLRLLRVMQFAGRFEMSVDPKLSQLCMSMDMSTISHERIEQEFSKLFLQAQRPSIGLQWLLFIHRFHDFFTGVDLNAKLIAMIDQAAQQNYRSEQEKLAVIFSLLVSSSSTCGANNKVECTQINSSDKKPVMHYMKQLTQSKKLSEMVADIILYEQFIVTHVTDAQLKWIAFWLGSNCSLRLVLHYAAFKKDQKDVHAIFMRAEKLGILDGFIEPLLTGKDFLDFAQGPQLGILVKKAYQIQIDQGLVDRSALKSLILKNY